MLEPYQMSILHMKSLIAIVEKCSTNSDQHISLGVLKDCQKSLNNLIDKLEPLLEVQEVN